MFADKFKPVRSPYPIPEDLPCLTIILDNRNRYLQTAAIIPCAGHGLMSSILTTVSLSSYFCFFLSSSVSCQRHFYRHDKFNPSAVAEFAFDFAAPADFIESLPHIHQAAA